MFEWVGGTLPDIICPACRGQGAKRLLEVDYRRGQYRYCCCDHCASVFPDTFDETEGEVGGYQIGHAEDDMGLKHYVEVGAGVESLISPITAVVPEPKGDLLDVGCGFGFLVSAWNILSSGHGRGHGIELASYGHWGRELLGVDISHALLHENEAVRGRRFDYVFSAEVIEHVADPRTFLEQLDGVLKEDGILVLTTPDAGAIRAGQSSTVLMAALSPGAHQFILSSRQFERLLYGAGYRHVKVRQTSERLVAWASRSALPPLNDDPQPARLAALSVFDGLAQSSNIWVRGGALYRMFREAVNRGDFAFAASIEVELRSVISNQIGPECDWNMFFSQTMYTLNSRDALVRNMPCYLGHYLYYRGMLSLNYRNQPSDAVYHFSLSLDVNSRWVTLAADIAQEAQTLLVPCAFHLDLALSRVAHRNAARWPEIRIEAPEQFKHFAARWKKELSWPTGPR
jgi:SAM-dependent methyltransferase